MFGNLLKIYTTFGGVGEEELINATQTLIKYLANKCNLKVKSHFLLGFHNNCLRKYRSSQADL